MPESAVEAAAGGHGEWQGEGHAGGIGLRYLSLHLRPSAAAQEVTDRMVPPGHPGKMHDRWPRRSSAPPPHPVSLDTPPSLAKLSRNALSSPRLSTPSRQEEEAEAEAEADARPRAPTPPPTVSVTGVTDCSGSRLPPRLSAIPQSAVSDSAPARRKRGEQRSCRLGRGGGEVGEVR